MASANLSAPKLTINGHLPNQMKPFELDFELDVGERQPTILIVDDLEINRRLLRAMLKAAPYRVLEARRPAEALSVLETEHVDLLILDLMMPEMSGLEFCHRIKSNRRTQLVPILMITSVQGIENEIAGIASGADEFLIKPLHPDVVRTRVRAMLRNKAAIDSLEEAETILFALAQAVEKRDKYTGDHCERLARYSVMLGSAMGLPRWELVALHRGGFLHDIGKVSVPDAILFKKGSLTEEEWIVMRSHTTKGVEICRPMKTLAPVLPIIRNHHERWDGSGYPDGLKGEEIPLAARVLQIADIYDALTTARPYKPAFSREEALATLEAEAHRGWRDPELVSLFQQCVEKFELSNEPESAWGGELSHSLENMRQQLMR
ncbi:MAG TPA: HD domain-containing phosphohydrolase [Bryobacteraceae bacterium]|nr:HD domain-containing phosphohydrolase [Bryobacteraceae bacterium]